ncbi:MAG: NAD(P)/FAD-dependent oxidoreductase [Chitinophagaceae bacterium]|nr:NAD(P)/FAD-dependent oxidoreductase [Chitinophagaceae bacterium]
MQKNIQLRLLPSEATNDLIIRQHLASTEGCDPAAITGFYVTKHSIDARGKQPYIQLNVHYFLNEPFQERELRKFEWKDVRMAREKVVIIGAGPAGIFAALQLIEKGIKPIILERGKQVRARRRDLALLNKQGEVNPESNYCFGEGGAGTYSDGKLYTRSSKRGDVKRILELFFVFGAPENILYEAHPHIGTNKLPQIITAMREKIIDCGGEVYFEQKLTDLKLENNQVKAAITANGDVFEANAFLLATGHSARDIFELLHQKNILIEAKSFALGVRVEHPQSLIDSAQYHKAIRDPALPPASYSLVQQVEGKGVFSFCMCPGGIIAPSATAPGELVVNGWSPSKRNNPYANSGIVVSVEEKELKNFQKYGPLSAMEFQRSVEQLAFSEGGGKLVAPAARLVDLCNNKLSDNLPDCSYLPGVIPADMGKVLPDFILRRLRTAFKEYGKKIKGYYTNEALVVATESRTSSPVRIPRDEKTLQHPQINNLYPCGEGAGYAGGIVSAAMDGENVAQMIAGFLKP